MRDSFTVNKKINYQCNGIVDESVKYIEKIQLLRTDLWKRFVQQYKEEADWEDLGWRGEYWGKMMRGACLVYSYSKNPELYQVLTDTVKDMLSAQEENGRISTYAIEYEFDGWDLWTRKYVLLGMEYFLEICEDEELYHLIIDSLCRQTDYIMSKIGKEEGKIPITRASKAWRGLNSSSLLEPVVRLHRLTQNKKYLEFAEYIVNCGGTEVADIFELAYQDKVAPYQYPLTKAYEMTSCFEGLLEYYRETGIEKYKTAVINFADKVLETDFTIIGGSGCTYEVFDHSTVRQANTTNSVIKQETCVTVTMMKFFYQLTLLTGDCKYVDAFERSLYNAYLGAINTEQATEESIVRKHPDWYVEPLPFDSYSPLTAGKRGVETGGLKRMSDNHYYGCCACIGSAGIGLVSKMAVLSTKQGIAVNLFLNGKIELTTANGQEIVLQTETGYPVNGAIKIKLGMKKPERFELLIRIPEWSKKTGLFVNGEEKEAKTGYTAIEREWSDGDCIELNLDMRVRVIYPQPYGHQIMMSRMISALDYMIPVYDEEDVLAKKHAALMRGPIVLAQENRLGYSVDDPIRLLINSDGGVDAVFAEKKIAPYKNMLELEIPLANGTTMHVTDYASAGKTWSEESKMAAWMLTE